MTKINERNLGKTKIFESFKEINESRRGYGAPRTIVDKICTAKNFPDLSRSELKRKKEYLTSTMNSYGMDLNMSPKELLEDPDFDILYSDVQAVVSAMVTVRGKNSKFIKEFLAEFKNFGQYDEDPNVNIQNAIVIKNTMDNNNWPSTYDGLPRSAYTKLSKMIKSWEIPNTLSTNELAEVQKRIRPKYERFIEEQFSDDNIKRVIEYNINDANRNSEALSLLKVDIMRQMPDLYRFLKDQILADEMAYADWKIDFKSTFSKSSNSEVVSSSFTTYYYYNVELKIKNKTFKYKDIQMGTDHYSGGWG